MLAIVGSIPVEDYSIVSGTVLLEGDQIIHALPLLICSAL